MALQPPRSLVPPGSFTVYYVETRKSLQKEAFGYFTTATSPSPNIVSTHKLVHGFNIRYIIVHELLMPNLSMKIIMRWAASKTRVDP